jgi:hypothetical protein
MRLRRPDPIPGSRGVIRNTWYAAGFHGTGCSRTPTCPHVRARPRMSRGGGVAREKSRRSGRSPRSARRTLDRAQVGGHQRPATAPRAKLLSEPVPWARSVGVRSRPARPRSRPSRRRRPKAVATRPDHAAPVAVEPQPCNATQRVVWVGTNPTAVVTRPDHTHLLPGDPASNKKATSSTGRNRLPVRPRRARRTPTHPSRRG